VAEVSDAPPRQPLEALDGEARALIAALALSEHPEGGFYRETYRAAATTPTSAGERAASTAIYFLLPPGAFSALHRVRSDEVWHHYAGDPVDLHVIDEAKGSHAVHRLGRDVFGGERPQHVVVAGLWQAAVPVGPRFALCGCTVAPGFDFADFEMPGRAELARRMPALAAILEPLTR
jgi:predicted cupin superfamily sugar epimerase